MKKILKEWNQFLKEDQEIFGVRIRTKQKVFLSRDKFTGMRNIKQVTQPYHTKPKGLWYSCGDEWVEWLRSEMPQWETDSNYLYEVDPSDKVLYISSNAEMRMFESTYGIRAKFGGSAIDWAKVQSDGHAGIEICPYLGDFRWHDWYYGWDVASGCIWDKTGIAKVTLLAQRHKDEETA
jgi:hypothetical protein